MLLDIAQRTGTHNVTNGTANGRTMISGITTNTPTPADGDDMTWDEGTFSRDTALASEYSLAKVWTGDDYTFDTPLTYAALVAQVYRLQNEMAALAGQVVELREKLERWEGD